jgi:6-hydroxytryprostatin B O-methyltransferase
MSRFAMTNRLFYEPESGFIAHTPYSATLVTDAGTRSWAQFSSAGGFMATMNLPEAHQRWGDSEDPTHTAWNQALGSDLPFFDFLAQNDKDGKFGDFAMLMASLNASPAHALQHTVEL